MSAARSDGGGSLRRDHPTAMAFLDESGSIANDRIFAVGCLRLEEPSVLLRQVQKLRDRAHWYQEIHFADLTAGALPFYRDVVDVVANSDALFSCFVADRDVDDPVKRFGTHWDAYSKLAGQLLHGTIRRRELLTVIADNYSTPDHVIFEQDVRSEVNRRLDRLAVVSVCRLDSRATDALQIVDMLTSAVAFEFRQATGRAGKANNSKMQLADYVREQYGVKSFLKGCQRKNIRVATYRDGRPKRIPAASRSR